MCWVGLTSSRFWFSVMSAAVTAPSLLTESSRVCGSRRVGLEENLLQVEDDVGHILDHAVNGGELVHGAVNLDGGDGGAFQGGEEHAAQGVADGVAVAGFKGLGDELGVGFGGGCVFLDQPLGHFETS